MFELWPELDVNDCVLAQMGRHFILPDRSWLVIGRDERENARIVSLIREGDIKLDPAQVPGPTGLWRKVNTADYTDIAASILCRYTKVKKRPEEVKLSSQGTEKIKTITTLPASEEIINKYRM